jgi:hypothetical protein
MGHTQHSHLPCLLPTPPRLAAASCFAPFLVANGSFPFDTIASGSTCFGTCQDGYSGDISAACTNGVYTLTGTCEPGTALGYVTEIV